MCDKDQNESIDTLIDYSITSVMQDIKALSDAIRGKKGESNSPVIEKIKTKKFVEGYKYVP